MKRNIVFALFAGLILASTAFWGCMDKPTDTGTEGVLGGVFTVPTGDGGPQTVDPTVTPCGVPKVVDLFAGQTIDAGSVTMYNDATNLYVTVYSALGYKGGAEQIKMWVGADLLTLPRNNAGVPIPGQFPYKITTAGGTTYTFTIPLNSLSLVNACGDNIYVVVHADVLASDGNGGTTEETAFGGDIGGDTGNRWWYYTTYTIQCCGGGGGFDHEATAFAKFPIAGGGYVFVGRGDTKANPERYPTLGLTKNRWGWACFFNFVQNQQYSFPIYAGAGLNDITKGTLVGNLEVKWDGSNFIIKYNLNAGFNLKEVHIYLSQTQPTTTAPGQYGFIDYIDPLQEDKEYTIPSSVGNVWLIAHAVVVW